MHFLLLCFHIICAICFIGYVFFDAVIFPFAYKKCSKEECDRIKASYTKASGILFGIIFISLLVSGGALLSYYDLKGVFATSFGLFLGIKLFLIFCMFIITAYAIFKIRFLKKEDPFRGKSHTIALVLSFLIVILAKAMLYYG
ncbi:MULTISPECIES: trehalose-6-phosphate synthase [unclassified Helicobacter]|uniref:trehalose-6-phosphate synthase n=1 Tax=unclassified Helicobacter TaxID=2593540 RepID=UPI000CF0EE5B|nr:MULTISPECIES: trehalose-6-phosphate synthase [unclassified Helicobacter]